MYAKIVRFFAEFFVILTIQASFSLKEYRQCKSLMRVCVEECLAHILAQGTERIISQR